MDFATLLFLHRKKQELTGRQLANRAGLDHSTIHYLEKRRYPPRSYTVACLARGLQLSPEESKRFHLAGARAAGWKI